MEVYLLAHTTSSAGFDSLMGWDSPQKNPENEIDALAEFAGRACYESWHKPNPNTRSNEAYLKNIIDKQHFSVLEHASATFYLTGVSRTFTHELVRHRHLSFSQRSQRYVDESESTPIIPHGLQAISANVLEDGQTTVKDLVDELHHTSLRLYVTLVKELVKNGFNRKQAREAARSVLPNATETRIVVTGNMRSWRELIQKRLSPGADKEFQEVARALLKHLKIIAPHTFADIVDWEN